MLSINVVVGVFILLSFISIFTLFRWNRKQSIEHFMTYRGRRINVNNIHAHTNDEIKVSHINTSKSINLQPISTNPTPKLKLYDSDNNTMKQLLSYEKNPTSGKNEVHIGAKDQNLILKSNKVKFNKPVKIHKGASFNKVKFDDKVIFKDDINMSKSTTTPKICFGDTKDENCVTEDDMKTLLFYDSLKNEYASVDKDFRYSIDLLRGVYMPVDKNDEECDANRTSDITANGMIVDETEMTEKLCAWVTETSTDK